MRVLLFCNEFPPRPHGGIGTFCLHYARGLHDAGHSVQVVEVHGNAAPPGDTGVSVHRLGSWPTRRGRAAMSRARLAAAVPRLCRRFRPDIIETPDFSGWFPFVAPPVPLVVRLHGSTTLIAPHNDDRVRPTTRWFERRTLEHAALWIAPSRFILDATTAAFGLSPAASEVVFNPLPPASGALPPLELPRDASGPLILFAGWIKKAKGATALAEALPAVFREFPDAWAAFVGSDVPQDGVPTSSRIASIVGDEFARRVHFPGHVSHSTVGAWMRAAAVFALPSRFESFGLVYLEALRAGIPVIASNRSAEPELFQGIDGVELVDPESPRDIADALVRVLRDRSRISATMRANCEQTLAAFSLEQCVASSIAAYKRLLS